MSGILEVESGIAQGGQRPQQDALHALFELQVRARPQQLALVCGQKQMTYGELDRRANQLAHFLRDKGVGRGDAVAMLLERSMDVYVTLLGILKAGAAYVPLDPDYPEDRISYILSDCHVKALVTSSDFAAKHPHYDGPVIELDYQAHEIALHTGLPLLDIHTPVRSDDLCYVIYTSGSTGRPKGVQIEHRSACNLVRSEGKIFNVRPADRVYQGFSIAFDASVEEVWLAFFAGATLVVGTRHMVHAGPDLCRMLTDARVSVLSCVPTLLSMMDDDLPTVRLLILGGEDCPQSLVSRWATPGRRMVNTYGPTEATVIATYAECHPSRRVTIGKTIPNYSAYILDAQMGEVPVGEVGELHIGGMGLARGYVGRDDLTREKFVPNPFSTSGNGHSRLYKTGDLARWNDDGNIEFLGRVDNQVKLRGFRVELSEIESVLMQCPDVQTAAVVVREDAGIQQLVAYLVTRDQCAIDEENLRDILRARLPVYMMPALFEVIDALPTLPSGKVDRKALPAPKPREKPARQDCVPPRTETETKLVAVWTDLFAAGPVSIHDDFFLDLGGHSLLAARMVSELRADPDFQDLSMLDIYNHPTIVALATKLDESRSQSQQLPAGEATGADTYSPVSQLSYYLCSLGQALGLYVVLGLFSLQWLAPYLTYTYLIEHDYPINEALLGSLSILLAVYPAMLLIAVLTKWTVIGRFKAGSYPLWGWYYFRWWLVNAVVSSTPVSYLCGTPLLNWFYRLMGAKIGANVHLATDHVVAFDLLSIGDGSSVGTDSSLLGYTVEHGKLHIGPVEIGERCFVGTRSVVREFSRMEHDSKLEDLSMLPRGACIHRGERWVGSPAARAPSGTYERDAAEVGVLPSLGRRIVYGVMYAAGVFVFPMFVLAAIFPGMILMNHLNYADDYYWYLAVAPLVAMSFVVFLCLEIALVKWILLGRVKAGKYPLHSFFYLRKWFVDQLMELSLDVLGPLYSTIYLAPWYRLLGAKLGRRAEISTASFISPDLLTIDDEGFIADSVSLGAARVDNGFMTIAGTSIGKRSFIGNSALLPPGSVIGDNCLIGCLSAPPAASPGARQDDSSWLGSPSFFLPQRQQSTAFSVESTFEPTRKLWLQRAAIELCRVALPSTCFIMITSVLLSVLLLIHDQISYGHLLLLFPLLYAMCGMAAAGIVILIKWALMGRYRPCEHPLWSTFVWKTELVNALHEELAGLFLVNKLLGTPFISWYFRLLGTKIGRRVFMETMDVTEFDLVSIGDDCTLNKDCTLQTHLFEDRVMKMSTVTVGDKCSVGTMSLVLYDTEMEQGSCLDDLSLLMKGEQLPAWSCWEGVPAKHRKPRAEDVA
jgi:non-ribosomal peptide synthetase-like protein